MKTSDSKTDTKKTLTNATDPGAGGNAKAVQQRFEGDPQGQDVWAIIWCAVLAISGPIRAEVRACQGPGSEVLLSLLPMNLHYTKRVNFKGLLRPYWRGCGRFVALVSHAGLWCPVRSDPVRPGPLRRRLAGYLGAGGATTAFRARERASSSRQRLSRRWPGRIAAVP